MFSIKQLLITIKTDFQKPVEVGTSVDAKPAPDALIVVPADPPKATAGAGKP